MDRRKHPRLEIRLPLAYTVRRLGRRRFIGQTVNMSRSGILIDSLETLSIETGDAVEMEIELIPANGLPGRSLRCSGTVVRVADERSHPRFAIGVHSMHFGQASDIDSRLADVTTTVLM